MIKERANLLIKRASLDDLKDICNLDQEVIGGSCRREYLESAILDKRCMISRDDGELLGFLIYDENFFGKVFVSLIVVKERKRNEGLTKFLLNYLKARAISNKKFSLGSSKDVEIEDLFRTNGFIERGLIENENNSGFERIYFYQDPFIK